MSMAAAAELVGVCVETVRRHIDDMEERGTPVALRDRDERTGKPVPGSWRRPYRDAMEAWRDRRAGPVVNGAT
jgi:predicted ArsR family transcriptional regulator